VSAETSPASASSLSAVGEDQTQHASAPASHSAPSSSARLRDPAADAGEIAQPLADPLIGVVVADRYRIVELLGRGGMGIVYKVEHTRLGKLLAMKLLTGELSRNPEVVRRFKQEALTVSKLSSANTVQVFDFGVAEGLTYLVMELVSGEDLGRVLRTSGPMPFSRLGKILIQACTSLAEAHQKGIVHRDIKPENIMLLAGRDGTEIAKVLDFGLAKLREGPDLNDLTSHGAIVGTPYYMAPEQVRGDPVDGRTDIYGLGALMYRALTGHYPFTGTAPMIVFTKHLSESPVPPIDRAPALGISPGASRIVMKALAKSPEARYQSAEELQAALVAETEAAGASSVEALLSSASVRGLALATGDTAAGGSAGESALNQRAIATRDEVEAYERKLRRKRYGALVFMALVVVALGAAAVQLVVLTPKDEFTGVEREPNNTPGEANPLPLGRSVSGFLGKRLDPARSDRDFYAFDVPPEASTGPTGAVLLSLRTSALPNMAMCTFLYKQGLSTVMGRYCVGRPARDLLIPALLISPGRYLIAVMQDQDEYGGPFPPLVFENISDTYALEVSTAEADPSKEIEPNDQIAAAASLAPGGAISASFAWARDEDIFCVADGTKPSIRWSVTDVARSAGAVLEVTPLRGTLEEAKVRVHVSGKGALSEGDVMSPWIGPPMKPSSETSAGPRCIRARLVQDPWSSDRSTVIPSGGSEAYVIKVEAVP
jgi:eukaryotic-like serine/threonine-protein kinase